MNQWFDHSMICWNGLEQLEDVLHVPNVPRGVPRPRYRIRRSEARAAQKTLTPTRPEELGNRVKIGAIWNFKLSYWLFMLLER